MCTGEFIGDIEASERVPPVGYVVRCSRYGSVVPLTPRSGGASRRRRRRPSLAGSHGGAGTHRRLLRGAVGPTITKTGGSDPSTASWGCPRCDGARLLAPLVRTPQYPQPPNNSM